MREAPWSHLERHRLAGRRGTRNGAFRVPHSPTGVALAIIASDGEGWQHVSVSLPNRPPNWREMEFACRLFWTEDEAVMQLHPPRSEWISNHPHCLHLWKPDAQAIPLPPQWMVGTPALNSVRPDDPSWDALANAERRRLAKEVGQDPGTWSPRA